MGPMVLLGLWAHMAHGIFSCSSCQNGKVCPRRWQHIPSYLDIPMGAVLPWQDCLFFMLALTLVRLSIRAAKAVYEPDKLEQIVDPQLLKNWPNLSLRESESSADNFDE